MWQLFDKRFPYQKSRSLNGKFRWTLWLNASIFFCIPLSKMQEKVALLHDRMRISIATIRPRLISQRQSISHSKNGVSLIHLLMFRESSHDTWMECKITMAVNNSYISWQTSLTHCMDQSLYFESYNYQNYRAILGLTLDFLRRHPFRPDDDPSISVSFPTGPDLYNSLNRGHSE